VSSTNAAKIITTNRRHVDEEIVEAEAGAAADDDVGRVTDEGRRPADVGREDLGDQVGLRRDVEPVADHDGDRGHQHDDRDVVQQRGRDGGDGHQHHHQPVGPPAGALGGPDREEVEQAGLLDDADDDHHTEQQEDDVPVDALVRGEEDLRARRQAKDDHQPGRDEGRLDLVDLLGGDEEEARHEDRECCHAAHVRRPSRPLRRVGPAGGAPVSRSGRPR
jgi:hypothetical protein